MSDVLKSENQNPAAEQKVLPDDYLPMNHAQLKLQVEPRPGFVRYWFRGTPDRLDRARRAGYRFVEQGEVGINNRDLGGDAKVSGSTDMGTRVSVISGEGVDGAGQPMRLYLMECPEEVYKRGQKMQEATNRGIADALTGGLIGADETGESAQDRAARYNKAHLPNFFRPKT